MEGCGMRWDEIHVLGSCAWVGDWCFWAGRLVQGVECVGMCGGKALAWLRVRVDIHEEGSDLVCMDLVCMYLGVGNGMGTQVVYRKRL